MTFLITMMLALSLQAKSTQTPEVLRIDKISNNSGTIFGLRLNEDNSRASKAPDAEIECNKPDNLFLIGFCHDGFCETNDFDGDLFYNFYSHNESECYKTQREIKRIIKAGQSACLKVAGTTLTVRAVNKTSACF